MQGINKSPAIPIGGNPKKEKSGDDDEDDEEACVRYDENGNIIKKDDEDESFVSLWGGVSLDASREFEFRSAGARFFFNAICSCMWCESANDTTNFICKTYSYTRSLSHTHSLTHRDGRAAQTVKPAQVFLDGV